MGGRAAQSSGGAGTGSGTGNPVADGHTIAEMKAAFSEKLNCDRPIQAMYEDDDGSLMVRMCFSDVQFLHRLR